jgi:hypothetical protein
MEPTTEKDIYILLGLLINPSKLRSISNMQCTATSR